MKAPLSKTEFYNRKIEERITGRQTAREREEEEKRKESILDKILFIYLWKTGLKTLP